MNELEILKLKFRELYKNRPSTIRTTIMLGPFGWLIRIIGSLVFFTGLGLCIATSLGHYFFDLPNTDQKISNSAEAYETAVLFIQAILGGLCILIGILLISIGSLCRRIVNR